MKLESFVGINGEVLTMQKPTDIYPALDWIHSRMIELEEKSKSLSEAMDYGSCISFIEKLMEQAEQAGFGNHDDIDSIEY